MMRISSMVVGDRFYGLRAWWTGFAVGLGCRVASVQSEFRREKRLNNAHYNAK